MTDWGSFIEKEQPDVTPAPAPAPKSGNPWAQFVEPSTYHRDRLAKAIADDQVAQRDRRNYAGSSEDWNSLKENAAVEAAGYANVGEEDAANRTENQRRFKTNPPAPQAPDPNEKFSGPDSRSLWQQSKDLGRAGVYGARTGAYNAAAAIDTGLNGVGLVSDATAQNMHDLAKESGQQSDNLGGAQGTLATGAGFVSGMAGYVDPFLAPVMAGGQGRRDVLDATGNGVLANGDQTKANIVGLASAAGALAAGPAGRVVGGSLGKAAPALVRQGVESLVAGTAFMAPQPITTAVVAGSDTRLQEQAAAGIQGLPESVAAMAALGMAPGLAHTAFQKRNAAKAQERVDAQAQQVAANGAALRAMEPGQATNGQIPAGVDPVSVTQRTIDTARAAPETIDQLGVRNTAKAAETLAPEAIARLNDELANPQARRLADEEADMSSRQVAAQEDQAQQYAERAAQEEALATEAAARKDEAMREDVLAMINRQRPANDQMDRKHMRLPPEPRVYQDPLTIGRPAEKAPVAELSPVEKAQEQAQLREAEVAAQENGLENPGITRDPVESTVSKNDFSKTEIDTPVSASPAARAESGSVKVNGVADLHRGLREIYKLNEEKASAVVSLVKARAASLGMDADAFARQHISEVRQGETVKKVISEVKAAEPKAPEARAAERPAQVDRSDAENYINTMVSPDAQASARKALVGWDSKIDPKGYKNNIIQLLAFTHPKESARLDAIEKSLPKSDTPPNAPKTSPLAEFDAETKARAQSIKESYVADQKAGRAGAAEERARQLKGYAMRRAAERRNLVQGEGNSAVEGGLTAKERASERQRLEGNYTGKPVTLTNGQRGTVVGTAFGKIRVKGEDGTVRSIAPEDIKKDNLLYQDNTRLNAPGESLAFNHMKRQWEKAHGERLQPQSETWQQLQERAARVDAKRGLLFQKKSATAKGAVSFGKDGRAVLHALNNPDVSTAIHELFHVFRRTVTGRDGDLLAHWAGAKKQADGSWLWNTKAEEKVARAGEQYTRDGQAPVPALRNVFNRFRTWMREIYQNIKGSAIDIQITPEVRGVFDRMFTPKKGHEIAVERLQPTEPSSATKESTASVSVTPVAESKAPAGWSSEDILEKRPSEKRLPKLTGAAHKAQFVELATKIESQLPPVGNGMVRLWRGNRPGEEGKNPSFTNSLEGIALPFWNGYGGKLTFVDVPVQIAKDSLLSHGVAPDSEFSIPKEYAAKAKSVEVPGYPDAPTPSPKADTVGISNEFSADARKRLGLPERNTPDGRTFDEMYEAGKAKAKEDPSAISRLIDELRNNPERIVSSDTEAGLLLKHKVDLEHGLTRRLEEADRAHASGDANGEMIARDSLDKHRAATVEFTNLMERSGTAAGRALAARKMMSAMDYSLSHMEAEAASAKGSALNAPEIKRVDKLFQDIRDTMAEAHKRIQQRIAHYESKISAKDYGKKAKANLLRDPETIRLHAKLEAAKRKWRQDLDAHEKAKRSLGQKAVDFAENIPGHSKSLKASLDMSALLRQGWRVMFTNPVIWKRNALKSFVDAWKTFGGKHVMDEVHAEMRLSPYFDEAKRAKLAITANEEEFPVSLPGRFPVLGRAFRASEDAYTGFQYRNRMHVFEKMMDTAKKSGVDITDSNQLRSIGSLVNSLTSRARLGKLEPVANVMNNFFFSARKIKADFDFLTLHAGDTKMSAFARKQAVYNLAKVVSGTAMVMMIADAIMPGSVETDPRSADFGKIKVGNTRYDATGGVAPMLVLATRLFTGSTKSSVSGKVRDLNDGKFGSQTKADVLSTFFANKLSPVAGIALDHLRDKTFDKVPPTLSSDLKNLLMPMAISNFMSLQEDTKSTPNDVAAGVIADFFGIGTNTYDGKKKPVPTKSESPWNDYLTQ